MNPQLAVAHGPMDLLVLASLAIITIFGTVAVISPYHFGLLASRGAQWVDSNKIVAKLDQRIDIDHHVIRCSRLLGCAVLVAVAYLGYAYFHLYHELASQV